MSSVISWLLRAGKLARMAPPCHWSWSKIYEESPDPATIKCCRKLFKSGSSSFHRGGFFVGSKQIFPNLEERRNISSLVVVLRATHFSVASTVSDVCTSAMDTVHRLTVRSRRSFSPVLLVPRKEIITIDGSCIGNIFLLCTWLNSIRARR